MTTPKTNKIPSPLAEPTIICVEGKDAERFFKCFCKEYNLQQTQVIDLGGIGEIPQKIKLIPVTRGFEKVKTLIIIRDAESIGKKRAFKSVADAIDRAGMARPQEPLRLQPGTPNTGVIILSDDTTGIGSLEDICLNAAKSPEVLECVDLYLECLSRKKIPYHERKSRFHAYLAGLKDFAGMKLGEATDRNAWDLEHESFKHIREFLQSSSRV